MSQQSPLGSMMLASGLYAMGSIAVPALMMVNPGGEMVVNDTWKLILMTGLMPALIKYISVTGSAQLKIPIIMGVSAIMVALVTLLKLNKGYKTAMERPSKATKQGAIMSWIGTFFLYFFVMLAAQFAAESSGTGRFEGAAPAAAPAAAPMI